MKPRSESARPQASEDDLIDWLSRRTSRRGERWIGDDAATLPSGEWAVTMDSQIEGVHFMPGLDAAIVARRLLAVNLSDLAAMGALPAFAFLALAAPADFDHRRFFSALTNACEEVSLALAGGDLSRHSRLTAVLTLLGKRPAGGRWLRRGDALAGESLWLGGTIGEAAVGLALVQRGAAIDGRGLRLPAGLELSGSLRRAARRAVRRQLAPKPQLELGQWLGGRPAGAAIDLSDGLARDLHRLCRASGVGAEIDLDRLPLAGDHRRLARSIGDDWRQLALAGGEDYVLLFTLPGEIEPPERFACTRVGVIVESGVSLIEHGEAKPLAAAGWDHLRTSDP
jgi:thiamine-monophosphate kinase